jgi:hypothetical protein
MSQQFSALEYALGEELFCAFADGYLASQPSINYNLAELGAEFAHFLEINRPDFDEEKKEDWIDFIIELARFEYEISLIFEEKADEAYHLATDQTKEENLALIPVVNLFRFNFPIRWFYTEFKNGKEPDLPHQAEGFAVVLRHNFKLAIYDLHQEQFEFLDYLNRGMTIKEARVKFIKKYEVSDFDKTWVSWKSRWIKASFFRAV